MSDKQDKTVFRQPVQREDGTVIRPMPGGRSSGQHSQPQATQVPNPHGSTSPRQSNQTRVAGVHPQSAHFKTIYGLNPLVNAASMLIAVYAKTRISLTHPNVGGLHQQLVREIKNFETVAKENGVKAEIALAARYIMCTVLDEAVLNTPWGADSGWTQRTLLSAFHNETRGGEKFFIILERMRNSPAENLDILELMYICISLGYEGKYRIVHNGRDMLEHIRDDLFQIVRNHRGEYERSLSPSWHGLGRTRNTLAQYMPMWVIASIVGGIMLLSYSGFRYWLYNSSSHVADQLSEIANAHISTVKTPTETN